MKLSNIKVEQINDNHEVIEDLGEILTKKELETIVFSCFDGLKKKNGNLYGEYGDEGEYGIFVKNISYLGTPHPFFKKRIQIPKNFLNFYNDNLDKDITTLLIGIYKYKDNIVLCDFDTSQYVKNKAHNSSAHVYVNDLLTALEKGICVKKDFKGNVITCFRPDYTEKYLENKFLGMKNGISDVVTVFDKFFYSIDRVWNGIKCYQEMLLDQYRNAKQAEWAGFYLEYKFENFVKNNDVKDKVQYKSNKKKGEVDLDLYFPRLKEYGDLKTHTKGSSIQGNDYETIMKLIEEASVYYVVCTHDTVKDKDNGYVVTEFWNTALNKKDIHSYGNKMKGSVTLKKYCILEMNKYNKKYIEMYNQGKNSDGHARNPKIMINIKNIDNFIIHSVDL